MPLLLPRTSGFTENSTWLVFLSRGTLHHAWMIAGVIERIGADASAGQRFARGGLQAVEGGIEPRR